jgi:hypothetical protein
MQSWLEEMAAFVRAQDPKHLITVGSEGFYGGSTPELLVSQGHGSAFEGAAGQTTGGCSRSLYM